MEVKTKKKDKRVRDGTKKKYAIKVEVRTKKKDERVSEEQDKKKYAIKVEKSCQNILNDEKAYKEGGGNQRKSDSKGKEMKMK